MEVKIHYINKDPDFKIKQTDFGDWIDVMAAENVRIYKGEIADIPLGFSMKLPEGYEAWLVPRSSLSKKFKIMMANSIGIIDNSYSGTNDQWMFRAIALEDTFIPYGARIAQFRIIQNQPKITFVEKEELDDNDRGGLGSTGW